MTQIAHLIKDVLMFLRLCEDPPSHSSWSTAFSAAACHRSLPRRSSSGRCTGTGRRALPAQRRWLRKWPWTLLQPESIRVKDRRTGRFFFFESNTTRHGHSSNIEIKMKSDDVKKKNGCGLSTIVDYMNHFKKLFRALKKKKVLLFFFSNSKMTLVQMRLIDLR